MNRRQKIIVSVTGIFLVLLLLVGLTYAYFLTKINGNENTKSISVTTANLALVYEDGNGTITATNIQPGTTLDTKTFTVTNTGNDTVNNYYVVFEDVVNELTRTEDLIYTLTCKSVNASTGATSGSCKGVSTETEYPSLSGINTIINNTIKAGIRHEYTLTIKYLEPGVDQSDDMGATISGKINIVDKNTLNPYLSNQDSLAYHILNNSLSVSNGTTFRTNPLTTPAEETSNEYLLRYEGNSYEESIESIDETEYITYSYEVEINEDGLISLVEPKRIKYKDLYDNLEQPYFYVSPGDKTTDQIEVYEVSVEDDVYIYYLMDTLDGNSKERSLSVTEDDYGNSYYYRGGVTDNYINLNDMCWKIVRIEGDGSIKLVLEDYTNTCENSGDYSSGTYWGYLSNSNYNFGYTLTNSKYIADYASTTGAIAQINNFLNNTLLENNVSIGLNETTRSLLKEDEWCIGDRTNAYDYETGALLSTNVSTSISNGTKFYYETGKSLYGIGQERTATLKCNGDTMSSKIGALTADEIAFAGARLTAESNPSFYLHNSNFIDGYYNLSLISFNGIADTIITSSNYGYVANSSVNSGPPGIRPSITLKSSIEISSGTGIMSNPYTIK